MLLCGLSAGAVVDGVRELVIRWRMNVLIFAVSYESFSLMKIG